MAMAMSPQEGEEERQDQGDLREIRLALVMNGGVSLAIWMGGVTAEINRLLNREGPYGELLDLTWTTARVDVIAGASAGGINGAMLAAMMAHRNPPATELGEVRRIWLEEGGLGGLFRSPMEKDPPSLFKGDEYFLPQLRSAFHTLTAGPPTPVDEYPVRLTLTTTLLKPASRGFADDFGSIIADADHRGEFNFRRGPEIPDDFDPGQNPEIANQLALAARCTASFPVAFEPSYVPVDISPEEQAQDPDRPDMKGHVNFRKGRFAIDGGVLVNKPFRPAIRGIFAQPASDQPVRRVMAYVVPDPGRPRTDQAQPRDQVQTMAGVGLASAVTLPRAESVSRELEDIAEHNRRVRSQRLLREHILAPVTDGMGDLETLGRELFDPFVKLRARYVIDRLTTEIDPLEGRFEGLGEAPWNGEELRETLEADPDPWLPAEFPSAGTPADPWAWGNDNIEHMAAIVLYLLRRGLRRAEPDDDRREELGALRNDLHGLLRELRENVLRIESAFWERQAELALEHWEARTDRPPRPDPWIRQRFEDWLHAENPKARPPGQIAADIARVLVAAAPTLRALSEEKPSIGPAAEPDMATMVGRLVGDEPSEGAALRGLLATVIVQSVTNAGKPPLDQFVELIEVSADTPNGLDDRRLGRDKLAGRQMGHFGAFYKRSWRANDWMWGRMDSAGRLCQVLLDPTRLRDRGLKPDEACELIARVALGPPEDAETFEVLSHGWDRRRALEELAFLEQPGATVPRSLPFCARAVARRIQLRVAQEELPLVADAIEHDVSEGGLDKGRSVDFMKAVRSAQGSSVGPRDAARLFPACKVGQETIKGEARSELFATTATKAAAVTATAMTGSRSGLPGMLQGVLTSLRAFFLTLWVMARNAVEGTGSGFALMMFLLAAGGALLAVAALSDAALPGLMALVGTVVLLAGLSLAVLRFGRWKALGLVLLGVAVIVAFTVVPSILVREFAEEDSWLRIVPPILAVLGLVFGSMLLGLIHLKQKGPR